MTPKLQGEEWRLLAGYIHSICGIQLDGTKQYLIESRLGGVLREARATSYSDLYYKALSDGGKVIERRIIDAITTGETSFFRDRAPFDLLRARLLPEIIERRRRAGASPIPIRVWSAACSTGQEIYSIGIAIREAIGDGRGFDIRLLGTDISERALARASAGVYRELEIERGVGEAALARHFVRHHEGWKIRDEIRAMASFKNVNLLRDFGFLGQFDIVFCRNVAIYFSAADRVSLFSRIWNALHPGGALVLGSTESLIGALAQFEARRCPGVMYYERPTRRP